MNERHFTEGYQRIMFQFLIGTIQQNIKNIRDTFEYTFQFLIGTVQLKTYGLDKVKDI